MALGAYQRVANNTSKYNYVSNYASYYKVFASSNFGVNILGVPQLPRELPVTALDVRWVIEKKYEYRLDMIARKWYGDDDYQNMMWVLMIYNQPTKKPITVAQAISRVKKKIILPSDHIQLYPKTGVDPFQDFPANREIYVPARSTVEGRLF